MLESLTSHFGNSAAALAEKIVVAILVLIVGSIIIKALVKALSKSKALSKMESSTKGYVLSLVKFLLSALLIVIVISVLGVPMTSIIAALTSCLLAVGLALQGALSNLAGGLMIMIFKPFRSGDYITCAGGSGVVQEVSVLYTILLTADKTKITIPNGSLMNDCVVNGSAEELRRVDVPFSVAYSANLEEVSAKLTELAAASQYSDSSNQPHVQVIGYEAGSIRCALQVWCNQANYWDVYWSMMQAIPTVYGAENSAAPVSHIAVDLNK